MDTDRLIELIKLSGLLGPWELDAFLLQYPAAPTGEALAEGLIADGLLTRWQADKLLNGRHKGFFFDRYKLLDRLGKPGSKVYLALDPAQQTHVAIKTLPANYAEDPKQVERFRLLATVGMGLNEPAIIKTYELSYEGHLHFMVQEFVQGPSLAERVTEQGPLNYRTAIAYLNQTALGLQHLHQIGLLHRDLRPESLLLSKDIIKLVGFEHPMAGDLAYATHALHESEVSHIVDYMAPEYADVDAQVDHRADLYSLGCVLCFLLTGQPPFPEGTLTQRLVAHRKHRPPNLSRRVPGVPQAVVNVYEKLLAKDPAERFQSADEVYRALPRS